MAQLDEIYDDLIRDVLENGTDKGDRTGTGTRSVFKRQVRFDLDLDNFPIITEKKIVWNSLIHELVWMVQGQTNIAYLKRHDVSIWDEWADEGGDVGPVYGKQWRNWENPNGRNIDQLQKVIDNIRKKPDSRRHVVSAWNPADIPRMGLPPCHYAYQFWSKPTEEGRELSIGVTQRSCDLGLGVPFNWTSYATLLAVVCEITGHEPGEVVWEGGDVHVYQNHIDKMRKVLELPHFKAPRLEVGNIESIDEFKRQSVRLQDYEHGPFVKLPVAV
jgi:thymidylate synthase